MEIYLPLIFLCIAFFYSAIGFGGGSSYLALLSLLLTDFNEIRSTALILNVVVVGIGTLLFIRHRVFDWKEFWPFIVFSIPAAFLGAQVSFSQKIFFLILGALLILAALFMLLQSLQEQKEEGELPKFKRAGLGSSIGFLSGLVGIGGGIFLSPSLNLLRWKNARTIASLASVFILFNSLAGISGLWISGNLNLLFDRLLPLIFAVGIGGFLGSYLTNKKIKLKWIRRLTAVLVAYVGLRLILLHAFGLHI